MLPAFPDFVPLTFELKEAYNDMVGVFPPYSDITFATLQIWWNLSEQLMVSTLNGNLIINYHNASDEHNSGLSIVGKQSINDSINTLFRYLKENVQEVRLVHVPEFTVEALGDQASLQITEEFDYNEYLLDSSAFAKLEGHEYQLLRKKIKRFVRTVGEKQLELRTLDLTLGEVQDQVFQSLAEWQTSNTTNNDPAKDEHQALKKTFSHAPRLGIENLALYIDNKLHGVVIYHRPLGKEYYVLHHLKANYETPYISDYLQHQLAKKAIDNQVSHINIEMDLGIENLKKHKLTLRPAGYFRKFTISPKPT